MTLAEAIARFEGYFVTGSVAQRNNNPGNLRSGPRQIGTDAGGYAIYASPADGYADLDAQIQRNIDRGLTLREFFGGKPGVYAGYAPAADSNDPGHYADVVAQWVSINPDVPLGPSGSTPAGAADGWESESPAESFLPTSFADLGDITPLQLGLGLGGAVLFWLLIKD